MTFTVFISHSTIDIRLVSHFSTVLKQSGIDAYVAEENIKPGESLPAKIENKINKSDCVLALLTNNGSRSASVNQEIGYAKKANKLIVPIVEEGTKVGVLLHGLEYIRFNVTNPQVALNNAVAYIKNLKLSKEQKELIVWGVIAAVAIVSLAALAIMLSKSSK